MPYQLDDTLVLGVSTTALFDMADSDAFYHELIEKDPENAIQKYREYMQAHENDILPKGTAFPLVKALLKLNSYQKTDEAPLVEVVVLSRNSPETGVRVLKTIREYKLPISRSAFTAGEPVTDFIKAFDVDLFLTTSAKDAQSVIDSGYCAAAQMNTVPETEIHAPENQVRIAFDGDAVLFDEESELVYKTQGLDAFHAVEDMKQDIPLKEGPYALFLKKLARLQERLPTKIENSPVRIAIVTARSSPAEMRVIKTLRAWGVYVDEAFFLGGVEKAAVLQAFKPHIFFDDQDAHLKKASRLVPSGKVPYKSNSELNI